MVRAAAASTHATGATASAALQTQFKLPCYQCLEDVGQTKMRCEQRKDRQAPLCASCMFYHILFAVEKVEKNPSFVGMPIVKCPHPGCEHPMPDSEIWHHIGDDQDLRHRVQVMHNRINCVVCCEVRPVFHLRCCGRRNVCRDCMRTHVRTQMQAKDFVTCPSACRETLSVDVLRAAVGDFHVRAFLERRSREFGRRIEGLAMIGGGNADVALIDTICKHCPRCKVLIEKNEGCNDMSCRCGIHFCYGCSRPHGLCLCHEPTVKSSGLLASTAPFIFCWLCNSTEHVEAECPKLKIDRGGRGGRGWRGWRTDRRERGGGEQVRSARRAERPVATAAAVVKVVVTKPRVKVVAEVDEEGWTTKVRRPVVMV